MNTKTSNIHIYITILLPIIIFGTLTIPAYADGDANTGISTGQKMQIVMDSCGTFEDFVALCFAAKCVEDCSDYEKNQYSDFWALMNFWNNAHPEGTHKAVIGNWFQSGALTQICEQSDEPVNFQEALEIFNDNGGSRHDALTSGCPCPDGIEVRQDGCSLTFICKIGGDADAELTATTPCPQVRGSDPKYPLVKMLSGTLIEWNGYGDVNEPMQVSFGAPGGPGMPGDYLGAEFYMADYTVTLSSIDIGNNVPFDYGVAESKKNAKNPLDRSNFVFQLIGNNPNVEVLDQHAIYDAYKNRSKYVQAYTVLENKGYGERPWNTYEKFIDAMCDMSTDKTRCKRELAYNGHQDTGMQGNLYLGNGDMSVIGLYSEISSHGCHGATVINDRNEPAFAINIESTWCFYVHADYQAFVWQVVESKYIGQCCDDWQYEKVDEATVCTVVSYHGEVVDECEEETYDIYDWVCHHYQDKYTNKFGWESMEGSSSSSGDCGICKTVVGYIDENGQPTTEPLGISFYQSQPLLVHN